MIDILDPAQQPESTEHGVKKRCAFCAFRGNLTDEHIWPARFKKLFTGLRRARHRRGRSRDPAQQEEWEADAFTVTANIDCGTCNNTHLERIEREAAPIVGRLAHGSQEVVSLTDRRKLAAFALRMIAVGQYIESLRPVPRGHREYLVAHRAPPLRTEVWLWACPEQQPLSPLLQAHSLRTAGENEALPRWANAYRGLLRINRLGMEVSARYDGRTYPLVPAARNAYLRIWPLDLGSFATWPPDHELTEAEWENRTTGLVDFTNVQP